MREVKMGICFLDKEDNILTKRTLESNWTVDVEQDLKEKFDIYVLDEIATILTEAAKLELKQDVVKEMLYELKELQCQE